MSIHDNDATSTNQESNQLVRKNKRIMRILVVDDEYDISLTIKVVLEQNGFKVDSFNDNSALGAIIDKADIAVIMTASIIAK